MNRLKKVLTTVTVGTTHPERPRARQVTVVAANAAPDATIRWDKVLRAKAMIAAGTLDTPERLEAALDTLIDRLA
jgi:hypothetical protein